MLQALENLKSHFNCENCNLSCNTIHRIKLCTHIYCKQCISSIDKCSICNVPFVTEDVYIDNSLLEIFSSLKNIETELQGNDISLAKTLPSSCMAIETENGESKHIFYCNGEENKLTNLDCTCSDYIEIENKATAADQVDKKNAVGETKLHRACKKSNENEVKTLLESGACVNAQDYAEWTPLHEAIVIGNKKIVEWLIDKGSVVNAPGFNYDTPLHKAVIGKNVEIAKLLIKNGADIYVKNYEGISPWDIADSDMKFAMNEVQCGSVPLKIPTTQHYNIFLLGEEADEIINILEKCKTVHSINISKTLNEHVTHVISTSSTKLLQPSFELLLAILYNIPIVTFEWLQVCIMLHKLVNCKEYFIIGTEQFTCDVIQRTQINKYKLNPKLFSGCNIYLGKCNKYLLFDTSKILDSNEIRQLITVGGGKLLKREPIPGAISGIQRPWHASEESSIKNCAHYILYDPAFKPELRYNMRELKHVPYSWIFESILKYHLVNPEELTYQHD